MMIYFVLYKSRQLDPIPIIFFSYNTTLHWKLYTHYFYEILNKTDLII